MISKLLKPKYAEFSIMNLKCLVALFFVFYSGMLSAQQTVMLVTAVSPTTVCAGNNITVTFRTTSGNGSNRIYDANSSFTVYLSNNNGTTFTAIDTFTPTGISWAAGNGGITNNIQRTLTIPAGTVAGTGYKISVGSTDPAFNAATGAGASAVFTINAAVAGAISGASPVCTGTNSRTLTLSGNTGTIQWQSSSDNNTFNIISGQTGPSYTASNLAATTYYRALVTNGTCTAFTPSATITVNPASVAGIIGGAGSVCAGTNDTTLTLSGHIGTVQWQSSSNNVTFSNIVGATNPTYNAVNLAATTYYRAVVTSGSCSSVTTSAVAVTTVAASVAGSIGGATTVCAGTNSTVLTLSGHVGTIQWQSSSDNAIFSNISGATNPTYNAVNLGATTYYRAVVKNGVCSTATTTSVAMTVSPVSVGGSISGATTVCAGTNNTTLTLSGHTGAIQWQSSSNNVTFGNIPGATNATYNAVNLTTTMYYRVTVTSGVCSAATTLPVMITVNPASVAGSILGATTVCAGTNNTALTLSGSVGNIQWQSSADNIAFNNIFGATGTSYSAINLSATRYYRAIVTSGVCSQATTSVAIIVADQPAVAGTITGAGEVCSGTNSTVLALNGNTGTIQWQSSTDSITYTNIPGAINPTFTAVNITVSTYYRAVVSSGVCPSAISMAAAVMVTPLSQSGTITGGGTYCAGSEAILTLSGYTGNIQWQSSTNGVSFSNLAGENLATYDATVNGTKYYRVLVANGLCDVAISAAVQVSAGTITTWNGTAWDQGVPTNTSAAVIAGNFTASGNLTACSLTVSNNATVIVPAGFNVFLNGKLTVNAGSTFTLENNANLLQSTDVENSGNITVKRNSSAVRRQDYTLWSSPVENQNLLSFSPLTVVTPTSRFYQYNSVQNAYNSIASPGTATFNDAQAYLIRVANNHPAFPSVWNGKFIGEPNNGPYSYQMSVGAQGFRYNVIGNPYPSPISAMSFVNQNTGNITKILYFWRETNNSTTNNAYCSWSPAGGPTGTFVTNGQAQVVDINGVIQTGQGFFVEALENATAVNFNNSMRVANNTNQFFRNAAAASPTELENHRIWLNVTNATDAFSQTVFGYMAGATNGSDVGIDGRYINSGDIALYSLVDAQEYVIQGRSLPFASSDVVPLGFKTATSGNYTITIDHVDGLFTGEQNIYLRDNLNGTIHNLSSGAYNFTTDAGTFNARFEVLYENQLGNPNQQAGGVDVVVYKGTSGYTVSAANTSLSSIQVYDIRGRLLAEQKNINAPETTFTAGNGNQVVIVKIATNGNQLVTRKVVN
jgi:hypothetical protein